MRDLRFRISNFGCVALCVLALGCHQEALPRPTAKPQAAVVAALPPLVLHIPGIAGESFVDHTLRKGIVDGFAERGTKVQFRIYDWTENDPGIPALQAFKRNHEEAKKIAEIISNAVAEDPKRTIYITCHSGGAGLVSWALEDLPANIQVDMVLYIAPALSPGYDLSRALSHVRKSAYVFWSENDTAVLNAGTKIFGTIDRVYSPAAGYTGFAIPDAADKTQYAKLHQFPYSAAWVRYDNDGDHIGPMMTPFAQNVLAPTLQGKTP
jgi:hypothetical protein